MEKPDQEDVCLWYTDEDGMWFGSCSMAFLFEEGGPDDNGFRFCPRCGKALLEKGQDPDDASEEGEAACTS